MAPSPEGPGERWGETGAVVTTTPRSGHDSTATDDTPAARVITAGTGDEQGSSGTLGAGSGAPPTSGRWPRTRQVPAVVSCAWGTRSGTETRRRSGEGGETDGSRDTDHCRRISERARCAGGRPG